MPFKSEKQRRYMHANLPEIAQRWEQEYSNGGIMRLPFRGGGAYQGRSSSSGPAGGASAGGNYGGNSSGGVGPNQMSGAGPSTRDRPNPHTISGTSKDTFVSPSTISTSPQFTQEGRDTFIQNLRGPTWGQRIGSGINSLGNMAGNYIRGGGMLGMGARMLSGIFGPRYETSNREKGIMNQYLGPKGTTLSIERDENIIPPDGGDNIPFWAQLGYPSYEAWLLLQNQSIDKDDEIDETGEGVFESRFLYNRTPEEREAIEQMINEKFSGEEWDYNRFGLGDMDGS
jgi:hypothetical protein